jgi:hypothetical protein
MQVARPEPFRGNHAVPLPISEPQPALSEALRMSVPQTHLEHLGFRLGIVMMPCSPFCSFQFASSRLINLPVFMESCSCSLIWKHTGSPHRRHNSLPDEAVQDAVPGKRGSHVVLALSPPYGTTHGIHHGCWSSGIEPQSSRCSDAMVVSITVSRNVLLRCWRVSAAGDLESVSVMSGGAATPIASNRFPGATRRRSCLASLEFKNLKSPSDPTRPFKV